MIKYIKNCDKQYFRVRMDIFIGFLTLFLSKVDDTKGNVFEIGTEVNRLVTSRYNMRKLFGTFNSFASLTKSLLFLIGIFKVRYLLYFCDF